MHRAYKGAILYFLLFSLLLLASSILIFEHKIGLHVEGVLAYYLGSEVLYIPAKTISGILKIILPHIFAFGLFAMVLLHFVVFTKKATAWLTTLFFVTMLFELFSPLMIVSGYTSFAYLKLLSFFLFEALVFYVLWILFMSILKK